MTDKTSMVFTWGEVEPAFLGRLLRARARDLQVVLTAADLKALTAADLLSNAEHNLGRPPTKAAFRGRTVVDLLRGAWLRSQPATTTDRVVELLSVGVRNKAPAGKLQRLSYLAKLKKTETLCLALRAAFIASYKTAQPVKSQTVVIGGTKGSQGRVPGSGVTRRVLLCE